MGSEKTSTELTIVGAGPGGYAAAFLAADLGMETTLIDPEPNPGGVCLYEGCIPSKALLHVAKVITDAREAAEWGVEFSGCTIHLEKVRSWKDGVVQKLTSGLKALIKNRKIDYGQGKARFLTPTSLSIEAPGKEGREISFQHCIVATGSRPATIPGLPVGTGRVMNSRDALNLEDIPGRLLVIGGGYIGLELGSVYAALGSQVTVVEIMPDLLPGVDRDLVGPLAKRLRERFQAILLNTRVASLEESSTGIRVSFEGKESPADQPREFDRVLVSVGRKPNSGDLGLENTKVKMDESGFILVDGQRCTEEHTIYAIGDVAGQPMLAHKASHEGRTAVEAIAGKNVTFEPRAIPAVVFTDPEIAWCGLTETQAKAKGIDVEVARFPWSASGRAATLGRSEGVTKIILEPESERLLGVGICGSGAGEMIIEGVLAVEMGASGGDLSLTIHPHPTLSETMMEAGEVFFGTATHLFRPRKKQGESR
jgi:dihydrolipoamide dehydrogenase